MTTKSKKNIFTRLSGILLLSLIISLNSCSSNSNKTGPGSDSTAIKKQALKDNPYMGLRQLALDCTAKSIGLSEEGKDKIFGVVMDWDLGKGIMTLATFKTGDASVYFNNGNAVLGAGKKQNVSVAAKNFIELSSAYLEHAEKSDSIGLPDKDCVKFYFLTSGGRYVVQEKMSEISKKTSPWADYFNEANKVITEIRFASAKKN